MFFVGSLFPPSSSQPLNIGTGHPQLSPWAAPLFCVYACSHLIHFQGYKRHLCADIFIFSSNLSSQLHTHISNYLLQTEQTLLPRARLSALFPCLMWQQSWKVTRSLVSPFLSGGSLRASPVWAPTWRPGAVGLDVHSQDCTSCPSEQLSIPSPIPIAAGRHSPAFRMYLLSIPDLLQGSGRFLLARSTCHSVNPFPPPLTAGRGEVDAVLIPYSRADVALSLWIQTSTTNPCQGTTLLLVSGQWK